MSVRPGDVRAGTTGLVLAGGRATRMAGVDKGLVEVAGRPMVAHIIERLAPQVDDLVINANRSHAEYGAHGYRLVADSLEGFLGPLAGLLAGMQVADTDLVVTAPCDSPLLPADYVHRLVRARREADADIAVAHDGSRQQPVFLLARTQLQAELADWLAAGGRKIDAWFAGHRVVDVDFADRPEAFLNINTPADRDAIETRMQPGEGP